MVKNIGLEAEVINVDVWIYWDFLIWSWSGNSFSILQTSHFYLFNYFLIFILSLKTVEFWFNWQHKKKTIAIFWKQTGPNCLKIFCKLVRYIKGVKRTISTVASPSDGWFTNPDLSASRCFPLYSTTLVHLHKGTLNAPASKHTYTHMLGVEVERCDDSAIEIWKLWKGKT